jgi:hypothetical protein
MLCAVLFGFWLRGEFRQMKLNKLRHTRRASYELAQCQEGRRRGDIAMEQHHAGMAKHHQQCARWFLDYKAF